MKRTLTLLTILAATVSADTAQARASGYWLPYQANKVFKGECAPPLSSWWKLALWTGYDVMTQGAFGLDCGGGGRIVYYTIESPYGKFL